MRSSLAYLTLFAGLLVGSLPLSMASAQTPRCEAVTLSAACTGGDAAACAREESAALYRRPTDPARAACAGARACELGNAASCTRMGHGHRSGDVLARDPARSEAFFTRGCELGDGSACGGLAGLLRPAEGDTSDPERMARYLAALGRACLANPSAVYCLSLLRVVQSQPLPEAQGRQALTDLGRACETSPSRDFCEDLRETVAVAEAESACRRGRAAQCSVAGQSHTWGLHVARDVARGAELLERGCAGRDGPSCLSRFQLSRGDDSLPIADDALAGFVTRALPALEALCRAPSRRTDAEQAESAREAACYAAAEIRWRGLGTRPDPAGTVRALSRAGARALSLLGDLYVVAPDEATAASIDRAMKAIERRAGEGYMVVPSEMAARGRAGVAEARRDCDEGDVGACVAVAEAGPFRALIDERLDALCTEGNGVACFRRARSFTAGHGRAETNVEQQTRYMSPAVARCEAGQAAACLELAGFHRIGRSADLPRSDRFFDLAVQHVRAGCGEGQRHGCALAPRLAVGIGETRRALTDAERQPLLERGCELGSAESCDHALRGLRQQPESAARDASVLRLARRGCELRDFGSCRDVVAALERGSVPEAERAAVTAELAARCAARIEGACPEG